MPARPRRGPRSAAAIRYDVARDRAPKIVARGKGEMANRILALAREHGVPVREDPELMEALARLDVQDEIPAELYQIMAEVLTFIYRVNRKKAEVIKLHRF